MTQTAILQYEAGEKSGHHQQSDTHRKTSHETGSTSTHFSHNYPQTAKFHEEHHSNPQTHREARDWEAPVRAQEHHSHAHQSVTQHSDKEVFRLLSSPALTAMEDSHKTETAKPKPLASTS